MKTHTDFSHVKAIIFDMDGVLFFSSDCHEKAYLETLKPMGIKDFSYERDGAGTRTDQTLRKVFARNSRQLSEEELARLVVDKQTRVRRMLAQEGRIAELSEKNIPLLQKQFRLAIATSASRGTVDIFISKASYAEAFDFILDGSSVSRAKPDPEIYLLAAKKLNLLPSECVVIEDSVNGIEAAKQAGMSVIAITGTDSANNLRLAGAMYITNDFEEIASLLLEKK